MAIKEEKIVYDQSKNYTWQPEDIFEMNGRDFGLLLNTVRAILGTEQAAHIRLALQCNDAIEGIMHRAVEKGIAKETSTPSPKASDLLNK